MGKRFDLATDSPAAANDIPAMAYRRRELSGGLGPFP
jgi:hypothetical protein